MDATGYPTDEALMGIAIDEARQAIEHGDVPVGALVVVDRRIIARRHNEREATNDPTAHAELLAVRDAARALDSWRLAGATVVCTLEPCIMCAGALQQARVARVVYGAADLKAGACGSLYNVGADPRLNHEFETRHGVRSDECAALLRDFFASRRAHDATHSQDAKHDNIGDQARKADQAGSLRHAEQGPPGDNAERSRAGDTTRERSEYGLPAEPDHMTGDTTRERSEYEHS